MRRRRYLRAAVVAVIAISAATFAAFSRQLVLGPDFEMRGVFSSATQLKPGNPVRIAGLEIGRVEKVESGPGGNATVIMRIEEPEALRADTALAIEPRLLFEGNFYVNVRPGSPDSPPLRSGATVPRTRTTVPVQLDQVLSLFTKGQRDPFKTTLHELSRGLGPAEPGSDGPTGAQGLRRATRELDSALEPVSQVASAARGTEDGDLHRAVSSSSDVASQLARDPAALADMVTGFNRVAGALAADDEALAATVRGVDDVLKAAPRSLRSINAAMPVLTTFGGALRPGLHAAPRTLRKTNRLLSEVRGLVGPRELPALVDRLGPVTKTLPPLEARLRNLFPLVTPVARCVTRNILPTLNREVPDGALSSGRPAWQDMLHMGAALTGTSPGFDANGGTLRIGISEGTNAVRGLLPGLGEVVGTANFEGVRPKWLGYGVSPQFRPDAACTSQPLPDLAARGTGRQPAGLRSVPRKAVSEKERQRKRTLSKLLVGSDSDRKRLGRMLMDAPSLAGRGRPRETAPKSTERPSPVGSSRPGRGR